MYKYNFGPGYNFCSGVYLLQEFHLQEKHIKVEVL